MIGTDDHELRGGLAACLPVSRWIDAIAAGAPYRSTADLLEVARTAADPLTAEEINGALAHHPRIGERASGSGAEARFSRQEQASADVGEAELAAKIADGNRAYEEKFDRIFLIRAAGRGRAEILAELQRRLALDDVTELAIVGEQLREIALLRIEQTFGSAR